MKRKTSRRKKVKTPPVLEDAYVVPPKGSCLFVGDEAERIKASLAHSNEKLGIKDDE